MRLPLLARRDVDLLPLHSRLKVRLLKQSIIAVSLRGGRCLLLRFRRRVQGSLLLLLLLLLKSSIGGRNRESVWRNPLLLLLLVRGRCHGVLLALDLKTITMSSVSCSRSIEQHQFSPEAEGRAEASLYLARSLGGRLHRPWPWDSQRASRFESRQESRNPLAVADEMLAARVE